MKNKILIQVEVPMIEKTYDLYIPVNKKVGTIKRLIEEAVQEIIKASGFITILTIGILAPIVEELVFRKAFKEAINNKYAFIIASGFVFGGLHVFLSLTSVWDLFYLIPYCSLGIAFSSMYAKTDNIYTSIIMHSFHNTVFSLLSVLLSGVIIW